MESFTTPHNTTKESTSSEQTQFVDAVYRALLRQAHQQTRANTLGLEPNDFANYAILRVLRDVEKYMRMSPAHAASAIANNAFVDLIRRTLAQRGSGAKGTRVVLGDEPIGDSAPDSGSIIGNLPGSLMSPDDWVEQRHHQLLLVIIRPLISPLAWEGFVLTAVHGLTQAEAAERLDVSLGTLNRELRKTQQLFSTYRSGAFEL